MRLGRIGWILLALGASLGSVSPAAAGPRVALVIAEAAYRHATQLRTPINDAAAVAQALRQTGFDTVTIRQNLDAEGLRAAFKTFGTQARQADVALVYYAGHGMEIGGTNYLIPVDATLAADVDVGLETVSLEMVQRIVSQSKGLKIIILDACRDNPFAAAMQRTNVTRSVSRGLVKVEAPDDGMLIAYSAAAGQTASDGSGPQSPFAAAFVSELTRSNDDVRIMFGAVQDEVRARTRGVQVPAIYASLGGRHYVLNSQPNCPQSGNCAQGATSPEAQATAGRREATPAPAGQAIARPAQNTRVTAKPGPVVIDPAPPPPPASTAALEAYGRGKEAYSAKSYAEALTWYRQAADQGNTDAQNSLGTMYVKGEGAPQDYAQAMVWYRRAADQGNIEAQNNMGVMYEYGQGAPKDYNQAMAWYRRAANQGNAEAQHNIGALYQSGRGITQNYSQAAEWYRKAAEQGLPSAQNDLATLYQYGWGVPMDAAEARSWFQKAARKGGNKARKSN